MHLGFRSTFKGFDLDQLKSEWNSHYIKKSHHFPVYRIAKEIFFSLTSAREIQYGRAVSKDCVQNIIYQNDITLEAEVAEHEILKKKI